jgi:hypothetical protein
MIRLTIQVELDCRSRARSQQRTFPVLTTKLNRVARDQRKLPRVGYSENYSILGLSPVRTHVAPTCVPAHLLLEYQPAELINALPGTTPTGSEMEGAARFFAGYTYGARFRPKEDKTLNRLTPRPTQEGPAGIRPERRRSRQHRTGPQRI